MNKNNKKGFTLAELLIVVAIIGVLVAVSIPIFTSQLEKAREATDLANLRAAKAAAVTAYLTGDADDVVVGGLFGASAADVECQYDAPSGKLVASGAATVGKGTATKGGCEATKFGTKEYNDDTVASGKAIKVKITTTGDVDCWFE